MWSQIRVVTIAIAIVLAFWATLWVAFHVGYHSEKKLQINPITDCQDEK